MTTLGEVAVEGVLSTTVLPDAVETVLLLLLTVLEIVEDVTVSVANTKEGQQVIRSATVVLLINVYNLRQLRIVRSFVNMDK